MRVAYAPEHLSYHEAARLLGSSYRTVAKLVRLQLLLGGDYLNGRRWVSRASVLAFARCRTRVALDNITVKE